MTRRMVVSMWAALANREKLTIALLLTYSIVMGTFVALVADSPFESSAGFLLLVIRFLVPIALLVWCWRITTIMLRERPDNLFAYVIKDLVRNIFTLDRLQFGIPVFALFLVFLQVFAAYKPLIPSIVPFVWDSTFAEWDHMLHFGYDPWRLTHALLQAPRATFVINLIYNSWFFVCVFVLAWQTFSVRDRGVRDQFLLSFVLIWIVAGTILATALSSVGPCFYHAFASDPERFAALMDNLKQHSDHYPVWALDTQSKLLNAYHTGEGRIAGISAMPSMHVAIATLIALLGSQFGRAVGLITWLYFFAIYFGSVHLGWHYAIDGIASVIVVITIWRIVGNGHPEPTLSRAIPR